MKDFMTVEQLIAKLSAMPPKAKVCLPIQTYTRKYPQLYHLLPEWTTIQDFTVRETGEGTVRIWVHLPEGFTIHQKKNP